VRSADGELVVAEVEDDVAESRQVRPAVRRRADRQAKIGPQRDVRADVAQGGTLMA